jgi:regulatory protein
MAEKIKNQITAIKAGKNPRQQRSSIYLDGKYAFSLADEVILKEQLKVGQIISDDRQARLNGADDRQRCMNAALQFLSLRPRSRSETALRLKKHGFTEADIAGTLDRLSELNLLNDVEFAEYWKENRSAFKPLSRRAIEQELRQKGVEKGVVSETLNDLDEAENAYKAAAARAGRLNTTDYRGFQKKIAAFLQRRGFAYGTIKQTVRRLWEEKTGEPSVILEDDGGDDQGQA